jgi:hypothetical protein
LLQFVFESAGLTASQAVRGETSGKLNIPAVPGYRVKTNQRIKLILKQLSPLENRLRDTAYLEQ